MITTFVYIKKSTRTLLKLTQQCSHIIILNLSLNYFISKVSWDEWDSKNHFQPVKMLIHSLDFLSSLAEIYVIVSSTYSFTTKFTLLWEFSKTLKEWKMRKDEDFQQILHRIIVVNEMPSCFVIILYRLLSWRLVTICWTWNFSAEL